MLVVGIGDIDTPVDDLLQRESALIQGCRRDVALTQLHGRRAGAIPDLDLHRVGHKAGCPWIQRPRTVRHTPQDRDAVVARRCTDPHTIRTEEDDLSPRHWTAVMVEGHPHAVGVRWLHHRHGYLVGVLPAIG